MLPNFDFEYRQTMNSLAPIHCSQMIVPPVVKTGETPSEQFRRIIREEVKAAIREESHRRYFADLGGFMSLSEVIEYTGMSRSHLRELRMKRNRSKSEEDKEAACFPEYDRDGSLAFRRCEIDAWLETKKR